ncbi:hypothetical protein LG3211_0670 [Lysobacter gummosus]|nr:hypothetical protein LG3211_0670 [Lysobacter gummosus]
MPPGIATILVADACAAPFLRLQGVGPAVPPLLRFVARPVTAALGETPHGAFPGLELSFLQDCFSGSGWDNGNRTRDHSIETLRSTD